MPKDLKALQSIDLQTENCQCMGRLRLWVAGGRFLWVAFHRVIHFEEDHREITQSGHRLNVGRVSQTMWLGFRRSHLALGR